MFKFVKEWWLKVRAWLDWARGRSPYGHQPRQKIRVLGPNGEALGDSVGALAYVSRHGFHESGVTCPCCGQQAVRPADWSKIVQTTWGEAVFCGCGRMLLASPDDDVDPVTPKKRYDPAVYHKFVRPPAWKKPRQRTLSRPPVKDDWVVIFDHKHEGRELDGGEGRVISVSGDTLTLSMTDGIAGSSYGEKHIEVPIDRAHVMVFDALRKGDRVSILSGPRAGQTGTVQAFKSGTVELLLISGDTDELPVERLQKITE